MSRAKKKSLFLAMETEKNVAYLSLCNVIIVCSLVSLSILDSLDDAPPMREVIRGEMSRVLTLKALQRDFHEYKDIIDADLARDILEPPFSYTRSTRHVVTVVTTRIGTHARFRTESFLQSMFTEAIGSDPVVYSILRRGLRMINDPDTLVRLISEMNVEFGLSLDDNMDAVIDMYRSVYSQLV